MRDVIKIFAAGAILTGYALLTPTLVEAVPGGTDAGKPYGQRLSQIEDDAPASIIETLESRIAAPRSGLPTLVRLGASS